MKVAVYHNLPSGGGKRALLEQVSRLSQRHTVDVYTLSTADHEFCDLRPFVRRHYVTPFSPGKLFKSPLGRLNQATRTVDLWRLERVQRGIADTIDAKGYDVVLVGNCQFSATPLVLNYLRTATVLYSQEPPRGSIEPAPKRPYSEHTRFQQLGNLFDPFPGIYQRTLLSLDRNAARCATRVLVNSYYSRESYYRTYGDMSWVNYLATDTERFAPLGLERENFALSVGALSPGKGYDFLCKSLGLVPRERRPRLVLVGNMAFEPEVDYLVDLAHCCDVELDLRQRIPDEELIRLYNSAIATVYSPIMEPFGLAPIESMACGTPVVAVREAGVRETVRHNQTGLLTDRDPAAFAKALESLITDDELRERFGRAARQYVVETWSWARSVQELEKHLAAAAGTGQAAESRDT